ncbi:MAG TPA: tyrosine-type recombinase/integrase [Solirubrobacteraceae bacterium]|nr:tyrosine-type recombinase/integrase [Solirubrobacteraceae bacterium]
MGRPATGHVVRPTASRPSLGLRFWAYGNREFLTLGRPQDGWTLERAERELAVVLRDVELGTWRRRMPDPTPTAATDPSFHVFASGWLVAKRVEVRPNTARSYSNDLTNHLLPFFKDHQVSQITIQEVDRYRQAKVREASEITAARQAGKPRMVEVVDVGRRRYRRPERALSARSINMHISLLAQILAVAVDHGHLEINPAVGRRRRLKAEKPRPVHLDSADQIAALLEAAGEMDQAGRTTGRRAVVAVLLLGGGRASATGALRWRDIDLANGRLLVGRDKTNAGVREVDMLPLLREILTEHKAASTATDPDDPVFVTSRGKPRDRHNIRQRVVLPAVRRADKLLVGRGSEPLPLGISPHKLRHTFASILVAIGRDPAEVMRQLGHTDPAFTLRVYTHTMRRSDGERDRLRSLVEGKACFLETKEPRQAAKAHGQATSA